MVYMNGMWVLFPAEMDRKEEHYISTSVLYSMTIKVKNDNDHRRRQLDISYQGGEDEATYVMNIKDDIAIYVEQDLGAVGVLPVPDSPKDAIIEGLGLTKDLRTYGKPNPYELMSHGIIRDNVDILGSIDYECLSILCLNSKAIIYGFEYEPKNNDIINIINKFPSQPKYNDRLVIYKEYLKWCYDRFRR